MRNTLLHFQEDIPDLEPKVPKEIVANVSSAVIKLKKSKFKDDEELNLNSDELAAVYSSLLYAHDICEDAELSEFGIEVGNCELPDFLGLADRIKNFLLQCGIRLV